MSHVIVCGLGQVGYRICDLLLRMGEAVTVVSLQSKETFLTELLERGITFVEGDARIERNLRHAGIDEARALIACTDHDLTNIEIGLDARRLSNTVRIVVRIFDANLAKTMEASIGIQKVLAMSHLAAPAFAGAAFGATLKGTFQMGDRRYVVTERLAREEADHSNAEGMVRLIYRRRDGTPIPAEQADADSKVDLVMEQKLFYTMGSQGRRPSAKTRAYRRLLQRYSPKAVAEFWAQLFRTTPSQLKILLLLILVVTVISVEIFAVTMNLSQIDAFYYVITTLSTVGYGDISPLKAPDWVKIYAALLMLSGSALIAILYSIFTDYLVKTRFEQVLGRQRIPESGHVIVAGLGNVGFRTVLELKRLGESVVAIDVDPNVEYRPLVPADTPVVIGDARDLETLNRAGLGGAQAVVIATQNDAINLSIGLRVKSAHPRVRVVIRLFDAEFGRKVENSLGIEVAMSASRFAAPTFVGAALDEAAELSYVTGETFCSICRGGHDQHETFHLDGQPMHLILRPLRPA